MSEEIKRCPFCDEIIRPSAIKCRYCGSMLKDTPTTGPTPLSNPETLIRQTLADKYELQEVLGRGGMATVYRAEQKNLNRTVALKVIHQNLVHDAEFVARFIREAQLSASLNHTNIVTVHDVGSVGSVHYMAMEFLEGEDLHQIVKQKGALYYKDVAKWMIPVAEALNYIHDKGLIHRDIKSSNIIITSEGRPVLMDFGIAYASNGTKLTQTGTVIGTPEYMSPEQAQGKPIDHRSDLYSLGVVMYECLTGKVPFKGDNPLTTINLLTNRKPESIERINRKVPISLSNIAMKLLDKEPNHRFESGKALAASILLENEIGQSFNHQGNNTTKTRKIKSDDLSKEGWLRMLPWLIGPLALLILIISFLQFFNTQFLNPTSRAQNVSIENQSINTNEMNMDKGINIKEQHSDLYYRDIDSTKKGSIEVKQSGGLRVQNITSNSDLSKNLKQDISNDTKKREEEIKNKSYQIVGKPHIENHDFQETVANENQITDKININDKENSIRIFEISHSLNVITEFMNEFDINNAKNAWENCIRTFSTFDEIEQLKKSCYYKLIEAMNSKNHCESLFWAEAGLALEPQNSSIVQIKNEVEKWFDLRKKYWQNIKSDIFNELVFVEGGNFSMGSEAGDKDEEPIHNVTVESFHISKYEIKNEQYCSFLNHLIWNGTPLSKILEWNNYKSGYSEIVLKNSEFSPIEGKHRYPVIEISWHGANQFCQWLGAKLPSEAQWEYAAKGGNKSKNFKYSGGSSLDLVGWFKLNSSNGTRETGQKNPNELGIYDMTGNVWEWCSDWYSENYYLTSPGLNPKGPVTGSNKVIRGGSWNFEENIQRVTNRHAYQPHYGGIHIGFRIIRIP
jgi:serine/threonine protein kinase/formylglycine-generating enzyme required for sulfatase activity